MSTPSDIWNTLLDSGASPNKPNIEGDMSLHKAFHWGSAVMVKSLVEHEADPMALDRYGNTCADYAASNPDILKRFNLFQYRDQSTSVHDRQARLRTTMLDNIEMVANDRTDDSELLLVSMSHPGHCLKFCGLDSEARTSFQTNVLHLSTDLEAHDFKQTNLAHNVICDGCDALRFGGIRRVCKTCKDIDICPSCFLFYHHGLSNFPLCWSHEFLEVPLEPFDEEFARDPCHVTDKVQSWVLSLKETIEKGIQPFNFQKQSSPGGLRSKE